MKLTEGKTRTQVKKQNPNAPRPAAPPPAGRPKAKRTSKIMKSLTELAEHVHPSALHDLKVPVTDPRLLKKLKGTLKDVPPTFMIAQPPSIKQLEEAYKVIVDHLRAGTNDKTLLENFKGTEARCVKATLETLRDNAAKVVDTQKILNNYLASANAARRAAKTRPTLSLVKSTPQQPYYTEYITMTTVKNKPRLAFSVSVYPFCCGLAAIGGLIYYNVDSKDQLKFAVELFKKECEDTCNGNNVNYLCCTTAEQPWVDSILEATAGWTNHTTFYSRGTGNEIRMWVYAADEQLYNSNDDCDCEDCTY